MSLRTSIIFQKLMSIPVSIFFNFYYLPFKQAIKLPILIYKPRLISLKGTLRIENDNIRFGMIQFGFWGNALYSKNQQGINWENFGGTVIFKGSANIGIGSALSIGKNAIIEFGDDYLSGPMVKIGCYKNIVFGEHCRIAWETIILDTDFHETINKLTNKKSNMYKSIKIGKNNWIGIRSLILKGTQTPDYCIVGAQSILNKKYDFPEYCFVAGNPLEVKMENVYRDMKSYIEI